MFTRFLVNTCCLDDTLRKLDSKKYYVMSQNKKLRKTTRKLECSTCLVKIKIVFHYQYKPIT